MFQKPNILRKKPRKKVVEDIPLAMLPQPPDKPQPRQHCARPCQGLRKPMQRITLDSYICEEYRIKKLQSGIDAPSAGAGVVTDNTTKPGLSANANSVKEINGNNNEAKTIPKPRSKLLCEKNGPNVQGNKKLLQGKKLQVPDVADYGLKNELPSNNRVKVKLQAFTLVQDNAGVVAPKALEILKINAIPTVSTAKVSIANDAGGNVAPSGTSLKQTTNTTKVDQASNPVVKRNEACAMEAAGDAEPETQGVFRATLDCPARKGDPPLCELVFGCRDDLIKHLKEAHTSEDAPYKCDICSRTFFWMSGLRAHVRSHHASRHELACSWPGCSKVFLLACRLKEHSRAHTGDKPYPCLHPSCGWAFRTASKLVRHARRHTGERRHSCRVCGRAFLRAEHRREHEERHAQPHARHKHRCTVRGCEQKFTNKSSLYLHTKKAHSPPAPPAPPAPEEPPPLLQFMINEQGYLSLIAPSNGEYRAARTHITWPLDHAYKDVPAECLLTDSEGEHNPLFPFAVTGTEEEPRPIVGNDPYIIDGDSKERLVEDSYIVGEDSEQQLGNVEQNFSEGHSYTIGAEPEDSFLDIFGDGARKPLENIKTDNNHNASGANLPYINGESTLIGSSGGIEHEGLPLESLSFVVGGTAELPSYVCLHSEVENNLPDYLQATGEEISGLSYIMDSKSTNPSSYIVEKQNLGGPLVQASSYMVSERSQGLESAFSRGRESDFVAGGEGSRMSESSESNVYTLRSDLFLHGNGQHEDSQLAMRTSEAAAGQCGMEPVMMHLGTELGLVDATTHLQEELMYSDPGVDESSFQVLLLSSEDGC